MPEPRAKRISQASWARHEDSITNMYICRNATLDEVYQYLEETGLGATRAQLRLQMKKWGLKKNMENVDWSRIAHLVERRRLRGRVTGICRGDRYYGPGKLEKEIARHCTWSQLLQFRREPTPGCPENIVVNTPRPKVIDITWPSTLPWLHFSNQYDGVLQKLAPSLRAEVNTQLGRAIGQLPLPLDLLQLGVFGEMQTTLFTPLSLNCSNLLFHNASPDAAGQAIRVLAYILSNNHQDLFFDGRFHMDEQFDILCGIFLKSGLTKVGCTMDSSSDYTTLAVRDTLLAHVETLQHELRLPENLHDNSIKLISWALQSPPKRFTKFVLKETCEAMILPFLPEDWVGYDESYERAADWIHFIKIILDTQQHTTDLTHLLRLFSGNQEAVLLMAALNQSHRRPDLVEILLEHKPSLSEMVYCIEADLDHLHNCPFLELSPLICAASIDFESVASSMMKRIMASRRSQRHLTREETFDIILALCLRGHDGLLDDWTQSLPDLDVNTCNKKGFSMLRAAVIGGHLSTFEKVLELGAKFHVPQSPLVSPLYYSIGLMRNKMTIRLVQLGARIDLNAPCPFDDCDDGTSFITCRFKAVVKFWDYDTLYFLLALYVSFHSGTEDRSPDVALSTHQTSAPPLLTSLVHDEASAQFVSICGKNPPWVEEHSDELRALGVESVGVVQLLKQCCGDAHSQAITSRANDKVYNSKLLLVETKRACRDSSDLSGLLKLLSQRPLELTGDDNEATAIALAAAKDNLVVLQALLEKLPSTICDFECRAEIVSELFKDLDSSFDPPRFSISPISASLLSKSQDSLFEILRQFGYKPDRDTIAMAAFTGRYELVKRLLEECTTWDTARLVSSPELMPLNMAVARKDGAMVQLLVDSGEEVNSLLYLQACRGRSPLQTAVEVGAMSVVEMLMDAGADVNQEAADDGGATALQLASIKGYMDLAKILLDRNADVNAPGARFQDGRTALQGAAENGRLDMVALLLSSGARTQGLHRKSFIVAVALAREEDHWVVERMLRERCSWFPEDEDALEILTWNEGWQHLEAGDSGSEWYLDSDSDWEPGSDSDDHDNHLDTATSPEEGWEHDPPGSSMDLSNVRNSDHLLVELTEGEALGCLEAEADTTLTACTGDANPDVLDSVASIGSAEADTCPEENLSVVEDANGIDAEMADACQHSSPDEDTWAESVLPNFFDDATWAEDAAPFMNDGFWYGGPL